MFNWLTSIANQNEATLRGMKPLLEKVNSFEESLSLLPDSGLQAKTEEFKKRLKEGETIDDILPEAFATVRETAKRLRKERHYDVQILGGIALHRGTISEMRTGEGKTLVATLPAYLNALEEKGVHVVTVNDYLSRRDAVWMGEIYSFLGLSVGVLNHDSSYRYDRTHGTKETEAELMHDEKDAERDILGSFKVVHEFLRPCSRKEAYSAEITYGTNSEFGFDYLRDNLEYSRDGLRNRGYNYAIVDEIDSILIDEARTPLIISAPHAESGELYKTFARIALSLKKDEDYTVEEKHKSISLTEAGIEKAENSLGVKNIYTEKGIKYVHHLETAVRAQALFERDKQYVVRDGEVVIVDEFTGRLQPGRRWSEGLHQAIEAKEGVEIQKESRTFASISYQNYFRLYRKLSGMTGTASTSAEEFLKVYQLDTVSIPPNKPSQRQDHNDLIFQTEKGKFKAIAKWVKTLHEKGQPALIGTVSIERNEVLGAFLAAEGIPHEILNAKNHEREGEIIAQAGKKGRVTIATNMAGRGVDIKLGGNPATKEEYEEVKLLGGLFVLGTERHEARRIDNQLRGRSGRQGDPGATQFFVSLEDNLMRVFASDMVKSMMGKIGLAEDEPIENKLLNKSLESAQEKIEGFHFDSRKHLLEYDDVMNHQRTIVYERRRSILLGGMDEIQQYLQGASGGEEEFLTMIEGKKKELGEEVFLEGTRRLILQTIDLFWVEHLEIMEHLRGSVNLRAYGQRDPLVEYKKEGLHLFKEMERNVFEQVMKLLPFMALRTPTQENVELKEIHEGAEHITEEKTSPSPIASEEKIGRNDPCPCGAINPVTGEIYKWKKCGMIHAPQHKTRTPL